MLYFFPVRFPTLCKTGAIEKLPVPSYYLKQDETSIATTLLALLC